MAARGTIVMSSKIPCGFIGTGVIGMPMALRLVRAGFPTTVWNRTVSKTAPLIAAGARAASSAAEVAERAELVMLCLTDTDAVEEVVFGEAGVASAAKLAGKVLVDHSSIRPDATREMASELKEMGSMLWLDAPVTGGVPGAERGELTIICGGEKTAFDKAREAMASYGKRITLMGPSGAGQVTKHCNQVFVGGIAALVAEALALAQASGIDPAKLPAALEGGLGDSRLLQVHGARMAAGEQRNLAAPGILTKDLDTVLELGRAAGVSLPMAGMAAQLLRLVRQQGGDDVDVGNFIRLYARTFARDGGSS
jgi:3-hydroxyisobutyrate dehydrogenase